MRIGIGKIGKSIQFISNRKVARPDKKMTAGSIDARVLFESIILRNPDHQFVLVGRSNYSQLTDNERSVLNAHGNIVDMWGDFKSFRESYGPDDRFLEIDYVDKCIKEIEPLDCAIFLAGGTSRYSVVKGINMSGGPLNVLEAVKMYQGPIHYFINETSVPYMMLVTDPRCFPEPFFDVWNMPKKVISQYKETIKISHRLRYDSIDLVDHYVDTEYRGIESMYTIDDVSKQKTFTASFFEDDTPAEPIRDIRLALFLNEGKPSRYQDVVDYVFHADPNATVYGNWNKELLEADSRFKAEAMSDLTHLFDRIKYTFCIPIKKGWATGKFWEMTSLGIIPFVHPEYDTQDNIGIPEFLRVKSPQDLADKMKYLDENPEAETMLWKDLNKIVTPEHRSGDYINRVIMQAVSEIV